MAFVIFSEDSVRPRVWQEGVWFYLRVVVTPTVRNWYNTWLTHKNWVYCEWWDGCKWQKCVYGGSRALKVTCVWFLDNWYCVGLVSVWTTLLTMKAVCGDIRACHRDIRVVRYNSLAGVTLKRKCRHFDEIFVTGCTGRCHFDNVQCCPWLKFRQNVNVFV